MSQPFIGAEAIDAGSITRGRLRASFEAVHPRVYVAKGAESNVPMSAEAVWLWTGRRGVIAGCAAAALHGTKWIDASTPIEVITDHTRPREGVIVREERIGADEICHVGAIAVTSPARTAFDLARHLERDDAVAHLDALAVATGVTAAEALAIAARYPGARGIRRARIALDLMAAGAHSHQETWLRLLLIDAGWPRPRTQIPVSDGSATAFIDMGYDEPQIGFDYEGAHHEEQRAQYLYDIGRFEMIERQGWIDIKVVAEHTRGFILHRLGVAAARRGWTPPRQKRRRHA